MKRVQGKENKSIRKGPVVRVNMSWQVVRKVKVAKEEESESIR